MSTFLAVRAFRRRDRDQLTDLVNRHVAAVLPGISVSVSTLLSSLESRPDEYVVDPWVAERVTLVAEDRGRVVAAAHLHRYRDEPDVGPDHRGTAALQWAVHLPDDDPAAGTDGTGTTAPTDSADAAGGSPLDARTVHSSDSTASLAADRLLSACLATAARWQARSVHADGTLPCPGVYGIPASWPHVRAALRRAGFVHTGTTEALLLAEVRALPGAEARAAGSAHRALLRTVGPQGTRFTAHESGRVLGYMEVDTLLDRPERVGRGAGLAELTDLDLAPDAPADTLTRLLAGARDWLTLCGMDRLLTCAYPDAPEETGPLHRHGFREITRTDRGWELQPG